MREDNKKVDLMKIVTHGEQPPNCDVTLQLKTTYADDGVARGVWSVDERFINGIGVAMGGFVSSAADIMMAYAIASKLEAEQTFSSIALHTIFHRPVLPGEVMVEAKVEKMGKKTAYVTADLYQNEKKAASAVSSVMIL